jgi:2,4-dienoyl-CoA reductase-like NADH-dependent reductase (Old Yellow Enzyme family)
MKTLFDPIRFDHGPGMRNRFMLAPLTNMQSHPDGRMSDAEHHWLSMRTTGGFGATMTCAAGVQPNHSTMPGMLGIYDDMHIEPLRHIASLMKANGNVALTQINHGGVRADPAVIKANPVCPYDDPEWNARALSTWEVQQLVEDYVLAANRADSAGFDGVELHGAHGQMITQFLNPVRNLRTDGYGGSLEDRSRIIREILTGIRARCRPDFIIGLRLSPERFEIKLGEFRSLGEFFMTSGMVDFMDFSLWDVFKEPAEEEFKGKPLIAWVADLKRGSALLGVAGKITTGATARACIEAGSDFVTIGRGAIIHHDFPNRVAKNADFVAKALPLSVEYLHAEGVSDAFIGYVRRWDGFVAGAGPGMYTYEADMVDGSAVAICIPPEDFEAEPIDAGGMQHQTVGISAA